MVYSLLNNWISDRTDDATCSVLCNILWEVGEQQAVERFAIYFYQSRGSGNCPEY